MCPLYVAGLIGPGDRKSIEPMAARFAPRQCDRLHHFIFDGIWDAGSLEEELVRQADRLVGGADAFLVINDTVLPKKGDHSVGVAPQYASMLGKRANCQTLVSLTLARDEIPISVGLRLFLPESWINDPDRMAKAGVPEPLRMPGTKPGIALVEIDRLIAAGVPFGTVLADAGYGLSVAFRQGLWYCFVRASPPERGQGSVGGDAAGSFRAGAGAGRDAATSASQSTLSGYCSANCERTLASAVCSRPGG